MRFSPTTLLPLALTLLPASSALNVLVGNDDGFAAANVREFYRLLKAEGYNTVLVAPVVDNSGQGGRAQFTNSPTLFGPSEYNIIPAGAPSLGRDPTDPDVFYYNGTPAACTFVALDYVIPTFYNWSSVDLVVNGPNFGTNLGPFLYTLSGTIGATYAAVLRSIPAIAFSAGNGVQRSYTNVSTTAIGLPDPATIDAQLSLSLVKQLIANTPVGQRILPLGYGINVNYPFITSATNTSCIAPPFIQTRLTGGANVDQVRLNATSNTFVPGNIVSAGANTCINGDCSLPGETTIVNGGCQSSVSVFTVDYDAPNGANTTAVRAALGPLVQYANATSPAKRSVRNSVKAGAKAMSARDAF